MLTYKVISGNQPLRLDDRSIWQVKSGSVAVFAIDTELTQGARRYLFEVKTGEALFALPHSALTLLAVALEPVELKELEFQPPDRPLLEQWIDKLSRIEGLPTPPATAPIVRHLSLRQGEIFQPDRLTWVQLQAGAAQWLGCSELPIGAILPVSSANWLLATSDLTLTSRSPDLGSVDLLQGLTTLQDCILQQVRQLNLAQTQSDRLQLEARQTLDRQIAQATIGNFAALLQPQDSPGIANTTDLLAAVGAVGKVLGVKIEPLAEAELGRSSELEAIARASRLRLRRVLLRGNWWQQDCGALVATTRDDLPVALLPTSAGYEIYSPQSNSRSQVNESIAASLNPTAYMFYRSLPDSIGSVWDLVNFALRNRWRDLLLMVGMGVAMTLASLVVPLATGILIDTALPLGDRRLLVELGLGLLLVALGSLSLELVQALAATRLETLSQSTLQAAVWDRLLKLEPGFFRQYAIGDLESRVSGITEIYQRLTGTALRTLLTSSFALLSLGVMLIYSPLLTAAAIGIGIISATFTAISGLLLLRNTRPLLEIEGNIFGLLVQLVTAVPKLRSAGAEVRAFSQWSKQYTQQLRLEQRRQIVEDSATLFNTVMPSLTAALIFSLVVLHRSSTGTGLSTGTFLAFSAAFGIFIGGATTLSNTVIDVLDVITLWKRSRPILAAMPEVTAEQTHPGQLIGRVELDRVTFRYRADGALTLDQVSLRAEPGEFVAIKASGSGKSTLFRLLLGFETPIEGTVTYDGQDLAGLDVTAVRRQLGVVLQTSRINAGTLFANISANASIALTEAWEAAELAGFADDIQAMPMGMQTFISEGGTNLSGGQRQRLIIARALALKPRILLFDEATSALDNRTQAIVSRSLESLGVTRIVIAHRLSTIRNADRIYVMQAGRVIQQGHFSELIHQPGLFAQLAARQLAESAAKPLTEPASATKI